MPMGSNPVEARVALGDDAEDEDEGGDDEDGGKELDGRHGDLRQELLPQPLHQPVVLLQLAEHFRQHAGFLGDRGEGCEEGREDGRLVPQKFVKVGAFFEALADAGSHGANGRRSLGRLLAEHVAQRQAGAQVVAQRAAQLNQAGQRQAAGE